MALALFQGDISPRTFRIRLALLLILQCLLSTEVLATMTLFGAVALAVAVILKPGRKAALTGMIVQIGCAYAIAVLLLSPFLYFTFFGGGVPREAIFPPSFFSADLLSFIIPGELMLMHPFGAANVTSRFSGNLWENGSYFSLPLLALAVLYLYRNRSQPGARILALLLIIIGISALGPVLHIIGFQIAPMPWASAAALPLIRYALPTRFANYGFLLLALIFSMWISAPRIRFSRAVVVAVMIALVPNPAFLFQRSADEMPAFFTRGLYRRFLRPGDNLLVVPYGSSGPGTAWQAQTGMYFRMAGGYIGMTPDEFRKWPLLITLTNSIPVPDSAAELDAFIRAYAIDDILVGGNASAAARNLPLSLGLKGVKTGGITLYQLTHNSPRNPAAPDLSTFQRRAAIDWFTRLLCGAERFIDGGRPLTEMNPDQAKSIGLFPDSQWSANLPLLIAGARNGAGNGLWVSAGAEEGTIAIGLPVSRIAAAELVSRYGADATTVLFPYPAPFSDGAGADEELHFMLITLRQEALRHCRPGQGRSARVAALR